jgi:hypothetical protein
MDGAAARRVVAGTVATVGAWTGRGTLRGLQDGRAHGDSLAPATAGPDTKEAGG